MSTYIIADIGANHDGQYARMLEAIDEAKHAGCSACKFQWVSDPVRMAKRRGQAYADGYAEVYAKYLVWPSKWHEELAAHCRRRGIDYMCTVFLPEDVSVVAPYVARFKVASFEAGDTAFLAAHSPYLKRVAVSTGMMSEDEIGQALNIDAWPDAYNNDGRRGLAPSGKRIGGYRELRIDVLHCVSSYPTEAGSLQLSVLRTTRDESDVERWTYAGFSDHSDPALTWTGALAVAAGAEIIEAHLRLDGTDQGNPDYQHAMTPAQFAEYVRNIRFAEQALGDGEKRLQPCETAMAKYRVNQGAPHGT
jgi:sialic acid synthase SpsE